MRRMFAVMLWSIAGLVPWTMANPAAGQCVFAELNAADAQAFDRFGNAVAIDGDIMAVGAFLSDQAGQNSGSIYVFEFDGESWIQAIQLVGQDTTTSDHFGVSVAADGDRVVVGADLHNTTANDTGAAYVFRRMNGTWQQEAKLVASDAEFNDKFGTDVSISGDLIIVGAPDEDTNGSNAGAAYIFEYNGSQWIEIQKIIASDGAPVDKFGRSVSIDADAPYGPVALVSSYFDDGNAGNNIGSVYGFRLIGQSWIEDGLRLTPVTSNPGDQFGHALDVDGDFAIIGANLQDEAGTNSGAAYLFQDNSVDWIQVQQLLPDDGGVGDEFGFAVAIDGSSAAVGSPNHAGTGAVYLYEYDTEQRQWVLLGKAEAEAASGDRYGVAVDLSLMHALYGSDQRDAMGENSGGVFVFDAPSGEDCDDDGIPDPCEDDLNDNGIPDDCENDCNMNGIDDNIDLADCMGEPWCSDCNANGVLDECDILDGTEADCDEDEIPDSCQIALDPSLDCDDNGALDSCDIEDGNVDDCNEDGRPDSCNLDECVDDPACLDCNDNGIPDGCDIASEDEQDCNANGRPDSCDIADNPALDINENGVIDGCDEDCNDNSIPDFLEIGFDPDLDMNGNGIIDSCEDCNDNGIPDFIEIDKGLVEDCNANGLPDSCDLVEQDGEPPFAEDCNNNGIPDSCDIADGTEPDDDGDGVPDSCQDCDGNGIPDFTDLEDCTGEPFCSDCNDNDVIDACDILNGDAQDCNDNGVPDSCDLADGTSTDFNGNMIPDECENADCNSNGVSDVLDILIGNSADVNENGIPDECEADITGDGVVDVEDLLLLLGNWGACSQPCPPNCPGDLGSESQPMDCIVDVADLLMLLGQWG